MTKLTIDDRFHEKGFQNFEDNFTQPRHRWYPFKEGFSSELVGNAIDSVANTIGRALHVLDPFCGSGTTPVAAAVKGHTAHAVEVSPFCAFTARVKCIPKTWKEGVFTRHLDSITNSAKADLQPSPLEGQSTFCEGEGKDKWLFNRSVLRAFDSVWRNAYSNVGPKASIFRLAAMRAAMECSNAKKDGKALRYRKDWKKEGFSDANFFDRFRQAALQFSEDMELAPIKKGSRGVIQRGDSRKALSGLPSNSFDLMVTSPPYLNSFDYSDVYRPELFLGGFVKDNVDLRNVRLRTLRSHVQVKWGGATDVKSALLKGPLEQLRDCDSLWNARIPEMVEAYFHDMRCVLVNAARVLKSGAEGWIVVSTSAYGGVHIPVDLILADLGSQVGMELKGVYVLRALRAAGQQQKHFDTEGLPLRESLIVLKKR